MVCGNDAADKGGMRRYNGCGRAFRWTDAPQYQIETVFTLPKPSGDALGIQKGAIFRFTLQEQLPMIPHVIRPAAKPHEGRRVCLRCERDVKETCFQCIRCPSALVTRAQARDQLQSKFRAFKQGLDGPIEQLWNLFLECTPVQDLQQSLTVNLDRLPVSYCWDCMRNFLQSSTPEKSQPLDKFIHTPLKERVCTPQTCCFRILQPLSKVETAILKVEIARWEFSSSHLGSIEPTQTHWKRFHPTENAKLETAFQSKKKMVVVEVLGSQKFFANQMILINNSTGEHLKIRRVPRTQHIQFKINQRIRIWWKMDKRYYAGEIERIGEDFVHVLYDDGDRRKYTLQALMERIDFEDFL